MTRTDDTDYDLTAGVITENATHGLRVACRLRAGIARWITLTTEHTRYPLLSSPVRFKRAMSLRQIQLLRP